MIPTAAPRAKGPESRTWLGPESRTTRVRNLGREGSGISDPYKPRRNHYESRPGITVTKTVNAPSDHEPVDNYGIRQWVKVADRTGFAQCSEVAK